MDLNNILISTLERGASDILLVAGTPPSIRISGKLVPLQEELVTSELIHNMFFPILSKEQKEKLELMKDIDFPLDMQGEGRFRVNMHYQRGTLAASLRSIPSEIPTFETLRLPKIIYDFVREPRGLILVTGATGSGKSTTQAVMLDIINRTRNAHVITVEDPIEFLHTNKSCIVEQREVGQDTPSFPIALTYVLRQNPDIIFIGEMRELETISTAIRAAETGHLVISTLHTNDAAQTIDRIIDVFPPHQQNQVRTQLSLTLQGVISQQLLPKSDGSGMVLASEVLKVTTGIRNIIRKGNSQEIVSMIEISSKYGMQTMDSSIKELYNEGLISYEAAISRASNQENLEKMLMKS